MGKAAAKKDETTTSAEDGLQQLFDEASAQAAKSRLITSLVGMGWRLAIVVVVPVVAGVKLDSRFGTKPSYALSGFMFAIAAASYMIYQTYQDIQAETQKNDVTSEETTQKGNE